jgi:crotonobetainyl-CoA:carnitine CoA-transferase CaiB-like acyl-CoA transferase
MTVDSAKPTAGACGTAAVTPLAGVTVVDATNGRGRNCGRYLAELGADLIRVEGGLDAEQALAGADIFLAGGNYRDMQAAGLGLEHLRRRYPSLVTMTITEFGRTGPRAAWTATDPVQMAMSGFLSRSGLPGRPPLLPPGPLSHEASCVQAAWCVLVALWRRRRTGVADDIDFSIFDATVQILDPQFGPSGTAAAADGSPAPRGRFEAPYYPTFQVRDGFIRIVCITLRQWKALFEWIGSPTELADPKFDSTGARFKEAAHINAVIQRAFAPQSVETLLAEGQRRGLPIAPILSLSDILSAGHYRDRGVFPRSGAQAPSRYVEIDTVDPAPAQESARGSRQMAPLSPGALPLEGLRVLDLGVIVMGGEAARLFADQGADVVKIESRAFPDGARGPVAMSPSFAIGHRNLKSVGLDLRHPKGLGLFRRLAAEADVVLNNFKPGTMERLGLGYDALSTVNPGLVMVSCSAFGDSGPWRNWMGYGPLVRAASGLASLWRYEDEPARFGDTGLTYPDHFAARVVNAAALAGLVRREKTGVGCHVRCSQAETVLMVLGEHLLAESAGRPLTVPDAPWGVFPCAGDDEWCVVTVQGDEAWKRLGVALDDPKFTSRASLATAEGRCEARAEIDAWLGEWTRRHGPQEAAELLQAAGVAAGPMQRGVDLLQDPQLVLRRQFRTMRQPELPEPLIVENGATIFASGLEPPHRPAPLMGAHTREACASWLGLNETELDELFACGALEHRA